jgi:hypothetical protein
VTGGSSQSHMCLSLFYTVGEESRSTHSLTHSLTHLLTYLPTYVTYLLTYSHCPHTHACPPSHCDEATLYRDWWFKPVTHVPVSLLHCGGRESFHSLTHSLTHLLTYLPTYVTYLLTYSHCPHTHALHTAHCAHSTRVSASG